MHIHFGICFKLFFVFVNLPFSTSSRIALIPSTGCYSHDMMMTAAGHSFSTDNDILWLQQRIYDFDRPLPTLSSNWSQIIFDAVSDESVDFLEMLRSRLWETAIPFNVIEWWDFSGIPLCITIQILHQRGYQKALNSINFTSLIHKSGSFDLVILDHMLNDGAYALAQMINANNFILLSNFPISDTYITAINIPQNPATVPSMCTYLPQDMAILQRTINMVIHTSLQSMRATMRLITNQLYWTYGYNSVDVSAVEEQQLLQATPSEFLLDTPRPISNQIKYFGNRQTPSSMRTDRRIYPSVKNLTGLNIDYDTSINGIIVISFGSIITGERIPQHKRMALLKTLASLNQTVIWHYAKSKFVSPRIPSNVYLSDWLPLKELLEHKDVMLMISHGGLSTIQEVTQRAVPVLGVPFFCDQGYNLRRLVDLGTAEMLPATELDHSNFRLLLHKMIKHIHSYKKRSIEVRDMILDYQDFAGDSQGFWLNWALRNGKQIKSRPGLYFALKFQGHFRYYCFEQILSLLLIILLLLFVLSSQNSVFFMASRKDILKFSDYYYYYYIQFFNQIVYSSTEESGVKEIDIGKLYRSRE